MAATPEWRSQSAIMRAGGLQPPCIAQLQMPSNLQIVRPIMLATPIFGRVISIK